MDEFVGLMVEQLAKRAREAAARAASTAPGSANSVAASKSAVIAAARLAQAARAARTIAPAPPRPAPAPALKVAPAPALAPVPAPVAQPVVAFAGVDAENPFGSLPGSDATPGIQVADVVAPAALLGAFAPGGPFLAAFILGEALAPPLALREPRAV